MDDRVGTPVDFGRPVRPCNSALDNGARAWLPEARGRTRPCALARRGRVSPLLCEWDRGALAEPAGPSVAATIRPAASSTLRSHDCPADRFRRDGAPALRGRPGRRHVQGRAPSPPKPPTTVFERRERRPGDSDPRVGDGSCGRAPACLRVELWSGIAAATNPSGSDPDQQGPRVSPTREQRSQAAPPPTHLATVRAQLDPNASAVGWGGALPRLSAFGVPEAEDRCALPAGPLVSCGMPARCRSRHEHLAEPRAPGRSAADLGEWPPTCGVGHPRPQILGWPREREAAEDDRRRWLHARRRAHRAGFRAIQICSRP